MRRAILFALLFALVYGCCVTKPKPVEKIVYRYVDSTIFHDSTIYVDVPKERIVDIVPAYDTLRLETSLATAEAYVDTTVHALIGSLENKDVPIKTVVKWKERIVYKDSVIVKEVPVRVEVPMKVIPWHYWLWFVISLIAILFATIKILK